MTEHEPDNDLIAKQEREYDRWYDDMLRRRTPGDFEFRSEPEEHRKYRAWREEDR